MMFSHIECLFLVFSLSSWDEVFHMLKSLLRINLHFISHVFIFEPIIWEEEPYRLRGVQNFIILNMIFLNFFFLTIILLLLSFLGKQSLYLMIVYCSMYIESLASLERSLNIVIENIGKDFLTFFLSHDFLLDHYIFWAVPNIL